MEFMFFEQQICQINYIYFFLQLAQTLKMRQRTQKKILQQQIIAPQVKLTKEEIVKKQLGTIQDNIINKLQNSELSIPKSKVPFLSQKQKQTQGDAAYQKLIIEKKKMEQRIKQLQNNQKIYLSKSRVMDKSKISSSVSKMELTQQDKQNLKNLRKKLKEFQKSMQKKDRQIEQQVLKAKIQEQQRIAKQRSIANQLKKIKIEQKLEQIKNKQLQRQSQKQAQQSIIKKIEQKKKLYQLLDENWKQKNNQQQQRKYQIMECRLKQKHTDFLGLRQHQKRYDQIMMDKKKQLRQKRLNSSRQSHNSSFTNSPSKYYTLVLKQQKQAKQEQQKKKQRPKLVHQKRLQYAAIVREQFAPKVKTKEDQQQEKQKQNKTQKQPKIVRLTKQQVKEMGNINLIVGNQKAKKKNVNDTTIQTIQHTQKQKQKLKPSSTLSNYPDYLKQVRVKKQQQNCYSGFYNSPKAEAEKIMNSKEIKKQDKIAKLKLLATRFDTSSADIIAKIQGKLQILEVIN